MAFMFFISGLFVRDSLMRKGSAIFPARPAWRLGVPFLISVFVLIADCLLSDIPALPIAGNDGFQLPAFLVAHAYRRAMAFGSGPGSCGYLLALDVIAAAVWSMAPRVIPAPRPADFFGT